MKNVSKLLAGVGITAALAVGSLTVPAAANAATPDPYTSSTMLFAYAGSGYRWGLQLDPVGTSTITAYAGTKKEQVPAKWRLSTWRQQTFGDADPDGFRDRPAVNLSWYQAQYFRINFRDVEGDDSYGPQAEFSSLNTMYGWYDSIITANDGVAKGYMKQETEIAAEKADVKKNSITAFKQIMKIGLTKFLAHPTRYTKTIQKKMVKSKLYKGTVKYAISYNGLVNFGGTHKERYIKYTITVNNPVLGSAWQGGGNTHEGGGYTSVKPVYNQPAYGDD